MNSSPRESPPIVECDEQIQRLVKSHFQKLADDLQKEVLRRDSLRYRTSVMMCKSTLAWLQSEDPLTNAHFFVDTMQEELFRLGVGCTPGSASQTIHGSDVQDDDIADAKGLDDTSIRILGSFRLLPHEVRLLLAP